MGPDTICEDSRPGSDLVLCPGYLGTKGAGLSSCLLGGAAAWPAGSSAGVAAEGGDCEVLLGLHRVTLVLWPQNREGN